MLSYSHLFNVFCYVTACHEINLSFCTTLSFIQHVARTGLKRPIQFYLNQKIYFVDKRKSIEIQSHWKLHKEERTNQGCSLGLECGLDVCCVLIMWRHDGIPPVQLLIKGWLMRWLGSWHISMKSANWLSSHWSTLVISWPLIGRLKVRVTPELTGGASCDPWWGLTFVTIQNISRF